MRPTFSTLIYGLFLKIDIFFFAFRSLMAISGENPKSQWVIYKIKLLHIINHEPKHVG